MHGWDVGWAGHDDDDEDGPWTVEVEWTNCDTDRASNGDCSGSGVGGGAERGVRVGSGQRVERAAAGVEEEGRCRSCSREKRAASTRAAGTSTTDPIFEAEWLYGGGGERREETAEGRDGDDGRLRLLGTWFGLGE